MLREAARRRRAKPTPAGRRDLINELDRKVHWLSAWMIHNANHLRPARDGLKVGGHQASSASMATILSALYFGVLTPKDRIAVKPHASPAFHAIEYLFGRQTRDQLERFRAFGGAQSYPSRTKDYDAVDFSTGSVGMGVAISAFASIVQDYLIAHGRLSEGDAGRMIAVLGDAELDEGNIYEALIEGAKHDLRNCWWIVDYNRQSLDATTTDRMFQRFDDIFRACGWDVVTLKYGRLLEAAFREPGGKALKAWIETAPNDLYAALSFQGGQAWRTRLTADMGDNPTLAALLARRDDEDLGRLMTNLGGHDLDLLLETFAAANDPKPRLFIAYTIKGIGLPFQGHKDNHSGLMTPSQMEAFQVGMGVAQGREWEKFAGLPRPADDYEAFIASLPMAAKTRTTAPPTIPVPQAFPIGKGGERASTQASFGKILSALAREGGPLADAIMTTSPDVTVSTNLGGFVNQRGLFSRSVRADRFKDAAIASPQKWLAGPRGQHVELGIAEHNLFTMLAAAGLAADVFGQRLLPIGTVYDPFINRGLDALNYACYQDARFLLVATPSGLTLAPEGGAHQSIHTPLIGIAQPGLTYFEPAFVDELALILQWSFEHLQSPDGGSVYLRLSTRQIVQPDRSWDSDAKADLLKGAYWHYPPGPNAQLALVYAGAVAPEALEAFEQIREDIPDAGLLAIPSPDLAHRDWTRALADRATGSGAQAHIEHLLADLAPRAALTTVIDGPPLALSWLGGVAGHRVTPLGIDRFGQSGDIPDLFRAYRLDTDAIVEATATGLIAVEHSA
ncbi:1-deoxy-D-xylulose-5-phosphate synthase N-terminal domain-containing protein [Phenylobacterium sp.]|uniref:1-deoxy-D-xylulose-5-phosphate synthase N-terminal domain-containing protein n=1 Tax=Phenylobacterium sp. TaxID=1871053 RepID=UPI002FCA4DC7